MAHITHCSSFHFLSHCFIPQLTKSWVAVKELKLRDYPPIMENQMEKKMENEMETGGI